MGFLLGLRRGNCLHASVIQRGRVWAFFRGESLGQNLLSLCRIGRRGDFRGVARVHS